MLHHYRYENEKFYTYQEKNKFHKMEYEKICVHQDRPFPL